MWSRRRASQSYARRLGHCLTHACRAAAMIVTVRRTGLPPHTPLGSLSKTVSFLLQLFCGMPVFRPEPRLGHCFALSSVLGPSLMIFLPILVDHCLCFLILATVFPRIPVTKPASWPNRHQLQYTAGWSAACTCTFLVLAVRSLVPLASLMRFSLPAAC